MVLLNFSSSCKTVINCAFNLKNPLFDQHNIKQREEEENPPFLDLMLLHMIIGEATSTIIFQSSSLIWEIDNMA